MLPGRDRAHLYIHDLPVLDDHRMLEIDGNAEAAVHVLDGIEGPWAGHLQESERIAGDESGVLSVEDALIEHRRGLNNVVAALDHDVDAIDGRSDGALSEGRLGGKADAKQQADPQEGAR